MWLHGGKRVAKQWDCGRDLHVGCAGWWEDPCSPTKAPDSKNLCTPGLKPRPEGVSFACLCFGKGTLPLPRPWGSSKVIAALPSPLPPSKLTLHCFTSQAYHHVTCLQGSKFEAGAPWFGLTCFRVRKSSQASSLGEVLILFFFLRRKWKSH